ncbi:hypothetical protein BDF22DRAFT_664455 [Syncephalis plumigaleata]|nr:hypothetical protein BDF22DRAFT_664455 [Syncephalis plumigaleata]
MESNAPLSQPHRVITTYGGKRSFQFSNNMLDNMEMMMMPKPNSWIYVDEECDINTFKSNHELRALGLQRRFADELDDLIISMASHKPITLRRSSAMMLCHKVQDVKFANVFRQHDFLVKFYDLLTVEEDDILLQACFLFILGVVVIDRRVSVWLASHGIAKHLEHLLCKSDIIWTTDTMSTGNSNKRSSNDRLVSQMAQLVDLVNHTSHLSWITLPSHHVLCVHLMAALMNTLNLHGTKWIDMLFNKRIFISLLSLLHDTLHQLRYSTTHKTMNETMALQCLRVVEEVVASSGTCIAWLIRHSSNSNDATLSQGNKIAICILRLCISITDKCTEAAKTLVSMQLAPILMQVIYRKVHQDTTSNDLVLLSLGLLVNLVEQSMECCQQLCTMRISTTCQQNDLCWQQCNCQGDQVYSIIYLARLFQYLYAKSTSNNDDDDGLGVEIDKVFNY